MSDELLSYYNQELSYLREVGGEFAKLHPKIAGRLRLGASSVDDPFVSRIIESFAFLTARIRYKLDDHFSEISDALLNILYPHYQLPIPSMSIMQFSGNAELDAPHSIAKHTAISCESATAGCRFRTTYPVTLWPLELNAAQLVAQPFTHDLIQDNKNYASCLRLNLQTKKSKLALTDLPLKSLRFYINAEAQQAYDLYELLFNDLQAIVVAAPTADTPAITLPLDSIKAVGFGEEEGLLSYPPNSFIGYRLLSEYFAFPQKFLFFELTNLDRLLDYPFQQSLEIQLYFSKTNSLLEKGVNAKTFALGCTPIINLFEQSAEPIHFDHTQTEYHIIADSNRLPESIEIYSINNVSAHAPDHATINYQPFYGLKHDLDGQQANPYWFLSRRPAWQLGHTEM